MKVKMEIIINAHGESSPKALDVVGIDQTCDLCTLRHGVTCQSLNQGVTWRASVIGPTRPGDVGPAGRPALVLPRLPACSGVS
jgi:hypothetical protein